MNTEALTLALERLGVEVAPMDGRTFLLRAEGGHARLTHEESDILFVVDGAAGSLVLREELGLTGKLAALTEEETGDDDFDDRFIVRGTIGLLEDEDRLALLSLPPPLALTLADGRMRMRVTREVDEATLAYGLVRVWTIANPDAFPASPPEAPMHGGFAPELTSAPAAASATTTSTKATTTSAAQKKGTRKKAEPARFDDDGFLEAAGGVVRSSSVDVDKSTARRPRDTLLDAVKAASSSFACAIARAGDAVDVRLDFAPGIVANAKVQEDGLELRVDTPQADLAVTPQRGLKGALAGLRDIKVRHKALDGAFIIVGDGTWLHDVTSALVQLATARSSLRIRAGVLHLDVQGLAADSVDVVDVVAAAFTVAHRASRF